MVNTGYTILRNFISLFVLAIALVLPRAHAEPSQFCKQLLTEAELQALPQDIAAAVARRTEALVRGEPVLVKADGTHESVLEGMSRELAKPIFDSTKRAALTRLEDLAKRWGTAAKEEIRLRYEEYRKNKISIELDADGLPKTELVRNNREIALGVLKAAKNKLGAVDVESQVAQGVIDARKKAAAAKIKEASDRIVTEIEEMLARTEGKQSPDWQAVWNEIAPTFDAYVESLRVDFPLTSSLAKGTKASAEATRVASEGLPKTAIVSLNAEGVPELKMADLAVRAYYDTKLATMVLEQAGGLMAQKDGVILVADHGDGSNISNAASWKYPIPKFADSNFNAIATDLPKAGVGLDLGGLHKTVAYLDYRYRVVRERTLPKENGQTVLPLVMLGRSMGSTKGYAHNLLYDGPHNPVDAYVLSSFSNPHTIELQIKNVYKQVEAGQVHVVPEMLDNALNVSKELLGELARLKQQNPEALKDLGDNMLFLQGNADEDGGATVVQDLLGFTKENAPLGHVYVFENPLLKYDIPNRDRIDPSRWEATHTLFSNLPNVKPEQVKDLYPGVPAHDLPALQDQYFEAVGVMYGFFDYMADSTSARPEMVKSRKTFQAYRQKLTGGRPFLEWYAEKNKITAADVVAAEPGRASRAARLKRVIDYWRAEHLRVAEHFSQSKAH